MESLHRDSIAVEDAPRQNQKRNTSNQEEVTRRMIQVHTHRGKSLGKGLACLGSLLAVFSFLVLPWVSLGFLGGYSAIQIVLLANQGTQSFLVSSFLWLELACAGGIGALSLIALLKKEIEQAISLAVILLGISALLGLMGMYAVLSQYHFFTVPFTAFLGIGCWWYAFGVALALIGGIVQQVVLHSRP